MTIISKKIGILSTLNIHITVYSSHRAPSSTVRVIQFVGTLVQAGMRGTLFSIRYLSSHSLSLYIHGTTTATNVRVHTSTLFLASTFEDFIYFVCFRCALSWVVRVWGWARVPVGGSQDRDVGQVSLSERVRNARRQPHHLQEGR